MQNNFNYNEVPKGFIHCLNAQCTRSTGCLRFLAANCAGIETPFFHIVNPAHITNWDECRFFYPDKLVRFAIGITDLFNNLPHAKAVKIKAIIYKQFGRNTFYRIQSKQRLINPEEQNFIRKVFIDEGITEEPIFDKYVDKYDW